MAAMKVSPTMSKLARHVVYINPVNMGTAGWESYQKETKAKLACGEAVNILVCAFLSFTRDPN